jgi:cell division protein FtsB
MGGRIGYSAATGIMVIVLCWFGTISLMLALIPLAVSLSIAFKLSGQSIRSDELSLTTSQESSLEAENARLRARVRELEERVKQLEDERRSLRRPYYFDVKQDLRLRADPQDLPPGWPTHQFNGLSYFVIPLAENRAQEVHWHLQMPAPIEQGGFMQWNPRTMPAEVYPRRHGAQHGDLIDDRNPPTSRPAKTEK